MEDKRRSIRFTLEVSAEYKPLDENNTIFNGSMQNISCDGICFKSSEKLKIGSFIKVGINIHDNNRLNISGKVRWSKEKSGSSFNDKAYMNGIELVDISKEDEGKFLEYYCKMLGEKLDHYLTMCE